MKKVAAAQLGNAIFATQTVQDDSDYFL